MAFDKDRACDLIGDALKLIRSRYPAGAMEWLRQYRPETIKQIKAVEAEMDAAVLGGKHLSFPITLSEFINLHVQGFKAFTDALASAKQPGLFPRAPQSARPEQ
jgi:hypothetical protein